jgi:uncharacterized protein YfiM (DUF2279 family)
MSDPARAFTMRHVQLLRALIAVAAALMITFSSDHSAPIGLSVFSGFVFVTALAHILTAWLVQPAGSRWSFVLLAVVSAAAGMASGVPMWRSDDLFFIVVSAWALLSGGIELLAGLRARRTSDPLARDAITVGAFGILLAVVLLLIPAGFIQEYSITGAGDFVLSGIILGVGMFGGYAAVVAVFLGIAGFTPRRVDAAPVIDAHTSDVDPDVPASTPHGGER